MSRHEVFHLTIPTPFHEIVLVPTALLLVLQIVFGWSWWVFLVPAALDVALLLLITGGLVIAARLLNAQARRTRKRFLADLDRDL